MRQSDFIRAQKREAARLASWYRGLLSWKFHRGQDVIERSYNAVKKKLFVANCARRFGKTFWAAVKSVETAIRVPKARIKYASAFLNDLSEFAIPSFNQVLEDCPDDLKPEWINTQKKWVFHHNGSEIKLIGLDKNPDGMRGNYIDLAIFEEAGLISNLEYLYSAVVIPATAYRPNPKVIMISTPPSTPDHPFQDYCLKAQFQDAYVKLTIFDNPMVTPQMIEEFREECASEEHWLREYMCEFVVDPDRAIIKEWLPRFEEALPRPEHFGYYHRYVAMDLGVRDLTAMVFAYYDFPHGRLVIEDEAEINGSDMTTKRIKDLIDAKEAELWQGLPPPYRRIADNNNPLLLQDLSLLHQLHFSPTGKDNLDAMVNELRLFINQGRLYVNPKCKKTIGGIKYGIWNKNRKEFERSKVYGHYDHLAALIYLVRNLDQSTNPLPLLFNTSIQNQYINKWYKDEKGSSTWKAFKKLFPF